MGKRRGAQIGKVGGMHDGANGVHCNDHLRYYKQTSWPTLSRSMRRLLVKVAQLRGSDAPVAALHSRAIEGRTGACTMTMCRASSENFSCSCRRGLAPRLPAHC